MFGLYVVTDSRLSHGASDAEVAGAAYAGGADAVQLRMKNADGRDFLEQARIARELSLEYGKCLIINDRVDIAAMSDADGVHLGQSDVPVREARKLLGHGKIVGVSVHCIGEAVRAMDDGADYLGLGPIFRTDTKPDAGPCLGLDAIGAIRDAVDIPLVAIGGINEGNIADVMRAGADSAAVVSAVVSQSDMTAATRRLVRIVRETRSGKVL